MSHSAVGPQSSAAIRAAASMLIVVGWSSRVGSSSIEPPSAPGPGWPRACRVDGLVPVLDCRRVDSGIVVQPGKRFDSSAYQARDRRAIFGYPCTDAHSCSGLQDVVPCAHGPQHRTPRTQEGRDARRHQQGRHGPGVRAWARRGDRRRHRRRRERVGADVPQLQRQQGGGARDRVAVGVPAPRRRAAQPARRRAHPRVARARVRGHRRRRAGQARRSREPMSTSCGPTSRSRSTARC